MRPSSCVEVGDVITLTPEAIENYGPDYADRDLQVTAVSRSIAEHPGYDEGAGGGPLVDTRDFATGEEIGFSLYDWEFEIVSPAGDFGV